MHVMRVCLFFSSKRITQKKCKNIYQNTCAVINLTVSLCQQSSEAITQAENKKTNNMATAKNVILTAIAFKGIEKVKSEAKELAEKCLCSESYVLNLVRKVKKGQIVIA